MNWIGADVRLAPVKICSVIPAQAGMTGRRGRKGVKKMMLRGTAKKLGSFHVFFMMLMKLNGF
jgi:hypothetical protein